MKIGIVTFHRVHNSGAMLQAFALKTAFERRGAVVRFVEGGGLQAGAAWPRLGRRLKEWVSYPIRCLNMLGIAQLRAARFGRFRRLYLPEEVVSLSSPDLNRHFDVLVVGSDQVWNPDIGSGTKAVYLLEDVVALVRRTSYAASFGVSSLDGAVRERYRRALQKFDLISVRETAGAEIVQELLGREVPVVLDPTLLLDARDYADVEAPCLMLDRYVLCYCPSENDELYRLARRYARFAGLRLVNVQNGRSGWMGCHWGDWRATSPDRFLSLIRHSECVITDSFHASVFSILYARPFVTLSKGSGRKVGSRLEQLLGSLGLLSHYVDANVEPSQLASLLPLDMDVVGSKIAGLREESFSIINALVR